jgi:hypothetical protein
MQTVPSAAFCSVNRIRRGSSLSRCSSRSSHGEIFPAVYGKTESAQVSAIDAVSVDRPITSIELYVRARDRELILLQSNSLVLYTQYIEQPVSINLLNMTA